MNEKRVRFFRMITELTARASAAGILVMPFWFHRTPEQQREQFAAGNSKCDGKTKRSKHQDWLAMDLVVMQGWQPNWKHTPEYDTLGRIWKELGGTWGHDVFPGDIYHFELK